MSFKHLFGATIIASTLLSQTVLATPQTITFKNQRGSTLELTVLPDNKIEGSFTTAVASKTCPQAINKNALLPGIWLVMHLHSV